MMPRFAAGRAPAWIFLAVLLLPLLAAGGCAVNPATGEQSFTGFMSPQQEVAIGEEEHPKLVKEFGGAYEDADLAAYVTRIGLSLARLSEAPDLPYSFTVLNDDKINAFALPGGFVHVTRGLIALADDEAELAGVLAHEIGHVVARHTAQRYSRAVATNLGLTVLGVLGSAYGVPSQLGQVASVGAQAYLQGFSRDQELEADQLGVRYLARAGYDPQAMASFLEKLRAHSELEAVLAGKPPGSVDDYDIMATHPRTLDRIQQAAALAGEAPIGQPLRQRERFLAGIDGIVYGDDPRQGVRAGRDFRHPDLGIGFTVPPDFVLFNGARQVVARGPGDAVVAFDMAGAEAARQTSDPGIYLARVWAREINLTDTERLEINGMPAATGRAVVRARAGDRELRLVVIRERPDRLFRFLFVAPQAAAQRYRSEFQRTTYSFHRLTDKEIAAIRPLRVKVVTVGAGDTVESLAARLPFDAYKLERFESLNGLDRNRRLVPGSQVKIVVN